MAEKKKSFAADLNPTMAILQKEKPAESGKQPRRFKISPHEACSKRVQLLMRPSVYNTIKEDADAEGASFNGYVNLIFEDYIAHRFDE